VFIGIFSCFFFFVFFRNEKLRARLVIFDFIVLFISKKHYFIFVISSLLLLLLNILEAKRKEKWILNQPITTTINKILLLFNWVKKILTKSRKKIVEEFLFFIFNSRITHNFKSKKYIFKEIDAGAWDFEWIFINNDDIYA